MYQLILPFLLLGAVSLKSQVVITSSSLPHTGDTLMTEAALLVGAFDLEDSGPDHTWNVTSDVLQLTGFTTNTPCLSESDAPFLYQLLFNNPFFPDYNADFAFGVDDFTLLAITFNDNYWFFQNNTNAYSSVGFATTINDIPLPTTLDPVDVIYELPLSYDDSHSGYSEMNIDIPTIGSYGLQQTRSYVVDGWGTLSLFGTDYDVIRVRTEIEATDSLYIDFIQLGQSIDRPLSVEYKWLSPDYNVPILQVTTTAGIPTSVQVKQAEEVIENISNEYAATLEISPNPAHDVVRLNYGSQTPAQLKVFDEVGKQVMSVGIHPNHEINIASLEAGAYVFVVTTGNGKVSTTRIVVQ